MDSTINLPVVLLYNMDPDWSECEREEADRESRRLGFAMRRQGHSVRFLPLCNSDLAGTLTCCEPENTLVFNWCEGVPGVDRSEALVAENLERLKFTYTGASPDTLRRSYDKAYVKKLLASRGISTPRWKILHSPEEGDWDCYPAIVKPACDHCSHGVDAEAVVMDAEDLRKRVAYVTQHLRQPALLEDFIDGREFHVPVWGNDTVEVLPPVEMDFSALTDIHDRLCTYDAKFVPESKAYRGIRSFVPARLTEAEMTGLVTVSKAAYQVLGCRDYGRIDVRMRDGVFYVLDINPNADISADASLALAAEKAGYCYGAMGSRVLQFAAQRHPQHLAPHQ